MTTTHRGNAIRHSGGERVAQVLIHALFVVFSAACVLPVILTLCVSFSAEDSVIQNGYRFIPSAWSLEAYRVVFADVTIWRAYGVTLFVTALGTLLSFLLTSMAGYALSVTRVRYRNAIAIFFYIPMVFNAGLVPWYMVMTKVLLFKNHIHALIVPGLVSSFNLFLMRNYFKTIPMSLTESAEIDGANVFLTYARIIVPLSGPIIATVCLFTSLGYWNNWSNALWFIDDRNLYPLQYFLYRIQAQLQFWEQNGIIGAVRTPTQTVQVATLFVTIGPIILVYPFVQRFFIKGIMIGAVKG